MVRFSISYNNELLKTYELDDAAITVGRLPENTISIANMGISRRHFRIECDADRNYVLTDLSSLNGTFVNNTKVKGTHRLSNGDRIAVGKYSILFEMVGTEDAGIGDDTDVHLADDAVREEATEEIGGEAAEEIEAEAGEEEVDQEEEEADEGEAAGAAEAEMRATADGSSGEEGRGQWPVLIDTNTHVVYRLDKSVMTMGNSENDDIFVAGFLIGDGHLVIEKKGPIMWIIGKRFTRKFKVNGHKTKNHMLEHKDRIEIGKSTFRYMESA